MRRFLLAAALVLAAVAMPGTAGAAEGYNYAAWGWSEPAGPHVDFVWGEEMPRTRLSSRWSVNDCEGDAWFLCIKSNGKLAGLAELSTFKLKDEPQISSDREEHGRMTALRRHARRHYRHFSEDRRNGCPADYEFRPMRVKDATVAGRNGVRYGFIVQDGDGRTVERVVSFATLTPRRLAIVVSDGLTDQACVSSEAQVFTPRQMKAFGPYLAQLAADGELPR